MKNISGMKTLAIILLLAAIGFAVWGVSGHTDAFVPATVDFLASIALLTQIRKLQTTAKEGDDK